MLPSHRGQALANDILAQLDAAPRKPVTGATLGEIDPDFTDQIRATLERHSRPPAATTRSDTPCNGPESPAPWKFSPDEDRRDNT